MKLLVPLFFLLFFVACGDDSSSTSMEVPETEKKAPDIVDGSFTDSRDGQSYKVTKVGLQTWMAENLNYKTDSSFCYNNLDSNCTKFGRLYQWADAQKACPSGWHLPSKPELEKMIKSAGGTESAGQSLKSSSGWTDEGNGTEDNAFSAYPAGLRNYDGTFGEEGTYAYFWSSTEHDSVIAYYIILYYNNDAVRFGNRVKTDAINIRCVLD